VRFAAEVESTIKKTTIENFGDV